jgi:outer membrane protein OmpA-like peptidoglycan-associated protein
MDSGGDTGDSADTGAQADTGECVGVEGYGFGAGCGAPPRCEPGVEAEGGSGASPTGGTLQGSPICGSAPGPMAWAWLVAAAVVLARRVRGALIVAALWASADALGFDADQLDYSDGRGWTAIADGDPGEPWQIRAALTGSALSNPVVFRLPNGDVDPILGWASTLAAGASITLDPRIRLGVVLPVHPVVVEGDNWHVLAPGDASASLAVPLSPDPEARTQSTWRAGLDARNGSEELLLGGFGSVFGTLAVRSRLRSGPALGAQLGARLRPVEELGATRWGPSVEYGAALGVPVRRLEVMAELFGSIQLRERSPTNSPVEALLGSRWPADGPVAVRIGAGGGLGRGVGNPRLRVLLGLDLTASPARDTDGDGYVDLRDLCPRSPEDRDRFRDVDGCPDLDDDQDGILDVDDACRLEPETVNGWRDGDGCPDDRAHVVVAVGPDDVETAWVTIDDGAPIAAMPGSPAEVELDPSWITYRVEAEGFLPVVDHRLVGEGPVRIDVRLRPVPQGALAVVVEDEAGAPIEAVVQVGVGDPRRAPGGRVTVRHAPGRVEVAVWAEGFLRRVVEVEVPAEGALQVEVVLGRPAVALVGRELIVGDRVRFGIDDDAVRTDSAPALDAVARWLAEHPEIELVRIEGHADDLGSPRYNLDLSQRRADSVRDELVARGIDVDRLQALGSGESVRVSEDTSERLVEFLVLIWDEAHGVTGVPVLP